MNEFLSKIPFYLEETEKSLFYFEWLYAGSSLLCGQKNASYEEWGQVLACAKLIETPNAQLLEKIGTELQLYQKIKEAIKELEDVKVLTV